MTLEGDNVFHLGKLKNNSIDSTVTDPPYGLKFMGKKWDYSVPSVELWREVLRVMKPGAHLLSFGGTRTYHRMVVAIEDAGFEIRDQIQWIYSSGFPKSHNLKDEWKGWGTALKPANEPIVLARKPLSEKTVAENVLKWRTGAINVDASRIGAEIRFNAGAGNKPGGNSLNMSRVGMPEFDGNIAQGRWPANVLFDGDAAAILGEPSRFFYVAKASKRERNAGLEGMPTTKAQNHHPTVKPLKLMEYLCRLITPPNGTVLDPFMGSGSTGVAAIGLGFKFCGIEIEKKYISIAKARMKYTERKIKLKYGD